MTVSSDGKFRTLTLSSRVVIVEALGQDWYDWGNYDEENPNKYPAFLTYYGCRDRREAEQTKNVLLECFGVDCVEIRKGKRTGWPVELKIRGMQRGPNVSCFELADLVKKENGFGDHWFGAA